MNDKPIDWNKPIQTRDGREVKIFTRDARAAYPVVGEYLESVCQWVQTCWTVEGKYVDSLPEHQLDLINVPEPKRVAWVNVYRGCDHESKEKANSRSVEGRIACIKIEYTPGEGLEGGK